MKAKTLIPTVLVIVVLGVVGFSVRGCIGPVIAPNIDKARTEHKQLLVLEQTLEVQKRIAVALEKIANK